MLVPDIVNALRSVLTPAEFQSLDFNIQVSCNAGNNTAVIKAAREKLDRLSRENSNVNLLEELPSEVDDRVLMNTDVALMPYFKPIEFGRKYTFDGTDMPSANLICDWSASDGIHTWLDGVKGGILVRTDMDRPIQEIRIGGSVFSGIFEKRPVISVLVNNRLLFERPFTEQYEEINLPITAGLRPKSGRYLFEIRCSESGRAPGDPRNLSLCTSFIEFSEVRTRATEHSFPLLKEDAIVFGKRGNADVFLLDGFSADEEMHSWTTQTCGLLGFQSLAPITALTMRAFALDDLVATETDFSVSVNGKEVFLGRPSVEGAWDISIDVREAPMGPNGTYRIACKVSRLGRAPSDSRELGWCPRRTDVSYA